MPLRLTLALMCLMSLVSLCGCRQSKQPMPGVMPSAGMLLDSQTVPLSSHFQIERCQIYRSPYGNAWYPLNVSSAKPAEKLLTKLFRSSGGGWKFLDFAEIPRAEGGPCPNASHDGRMILFQMPDVSKQEGEYPRQYPGDRRTYRVMIYDSRQDKHFPLDAYCRIYSLGWGSLWRADDSAIAFTAVCSQDATAVGQLVITDPYGHPLLDASRLTDLVGLEFICFSPDGKKVAALRPLDAKAGAREGGTLVEVDIAQGTLRNAGEVSALLACQNINHIECLVNWDDRGQATVAEVRKDK